MIDSWNFHLDKDQFSIKPDNKLEGRKTHRGNGFTVNSAYCGAYRKKLKEQGIYFPDINQKEVSAWGNTKNGLDITASIPKVIYGTNAFEVDSSQIELIYKKLFLLLDSAGILTSENELRRAISNRVDFSKIIKLDPYLGEANRAIYSLSGFDYKPSSDANFTKFNDGNSGTSIKFFNKTQGFVIYDVIGNLLSNGYTKTEKMIKSNFMAGNFKRNLIRIELSLERKDSFESVVWHAMKKPEKKKDFYLEDILKEILARDILLKSFNTVFNNLAVGLLSLSEMEDNKLRAYLDNSKVSVKRQEKIHYWARMATDYGISGTWEQMKLRYKGGSIATCKKELSLILQELGRIDGKIPNLVEFLRSKLEDFEAIKPRAR